MDIDRRKYQHVPRSVGAKRLSERGELLMYFKKIVNAANEKDGYELQEVGYFAKKCIGIPTKDLGRDLYRIKGLMDDSAKPSAAFHAEARRLRDLWAINNDVDGRPAPSRAL